MSLFYIYVEYIYTDYLGVKGPDAMSNYNRDKTTLFCIFKTLSYK